MLLLAWAADSRAVTEAAAWWRPRWRAGGEPQVSHVLWLPTPPWSRDGRRPSPSHQALETQATQDGALTCPVRAAEQDGSREPSASGQGPPHPSQLGPAQLLPQISTLSPRAHSWPDSRRPPGPTPRTPTCPLTTCLPPGQAPRSCILRFGLAPLLLGAASSLNGGGGPGGLEPRIQPGPGPASRELTGPNTHKSAGFVTRLEPQT